MKSFLLATSLFVVVGCGSQKLGPRDDLGAAGDDLTPPGGASDLGGSGDLSGPGDMSGAGDAPRLLLQGHYTIESGLDDGHVLVRDQAGAVSAVDETQGMAHPIVANFTKLLGLGKVAFAWSNNNSTLWIWTAAGGVRQVATAATKTVAASPDGVYVAYYDNHQGDFADLYVNRTDVDAPHKLLTGTHVDSGCSPRLGFVGSRLIASHCDGAAAAAISSWSLTDQTHLDLLAEGFSLWVSDRAETHVFVLDLDSNGTLVTPTHATPVPIGSDIQRVKFTSDSRGIVFRTGAAGLFREAATGGGATTLQANGVVGLYDVSPDANAVLFASAFDAQSVLSDLKLANANQSAAPVTLNATQTSGFMGPGFTSDSRYALFGQGIDTTPFVGSMYAVPVGGGATRLVAAGVDIWYTLDAAKVVFDDHFTPGGRQGTADIETIDLDAAGAAPKLLATQVNGLFVVSQDAKAVIYAGDHGPQGAGVYRLALP